MLDGLVKEPVSLWSVAGKSGNDVNKTSASSALVFQLGSGLSFERVHSDVFGINEQSGISVNRVRSARPIYEKRRNNRNVPKISFVEIHGKRDLAGLGILVDNVSAIGCGKLTREVADLLLEARACNQGQLSTGHSVSLIQFLKNGIEGSFGLRACGVVCNALGYRKVDHPIQAT